MSAPMRPLTALLRRSWIWMPILLLSASTAHAQAVWQRIGAPAATVFALEQDPFDSNTFLAGTYFGGLQRSVDGGFSWTTVPSPLVSRTITSIAFDRVNHGTIYVGTFEAGLFRSNDSGATWAAINGNLPDLNVQAVVVSHAGLLAATAGGGVFRSVDGGGAWTSVMPLTSRSLLVDPRQPGIVLSGGPDRVYRSVNNGETWTPLGQGFSESVASIAVDPERAGGYLVATSAAVLRLDENLASWQSATSNLPPQTIHQFVAAPGSNQWYVVTDGGIYRNVGALSAPSWTLWARFETEPRSLLFSHGGFVAHVPLRHGTMYESFDDGASWFEAVFGIQNEFVGALAARSLGDEAVVWAGSDRGAAVTATVFPDGSWGRSREFDEGVFRLVPHPAEPHVVYAGTERGGVWKSTDWGINWTQSSAGLAPRSVHVLSQSPATPSTIFAGTSSGLFLSRDGGHTWRYSAERVVHPTYVLAITVLADGTVYFGTADGRVFTSFDGNTYAEVSNGLGSGAVLDLASDGLSLLAITADGLFKLNPVTRVWQPEPLAAFARVLEVNTAVPGTAYIGTIGGGLVIRAAGGFVPTTGINEPDVHSVTVDLQHPNIVYAASRFVYRSVDGGLNWTRLLGDGLPNLPIVALQVDLMNPATLYAQVEQFGTYRSLDGGGTWMLIRGGPARGALLADLGSGGLLSAADFQGVFRSTDAGSTWDWSAAGMSVFVRALAIDPQTPNTLYAGAVQGGVYRTGDGGATWGLAGLGDKLIEDVEVHPAYPQLIFAAATEGVYRSVNGGATWSQNTLRDGNGGSLFTLDVAVDPQQPSTLYAGTGGNGVWKSTDFGHSWSPANGGLTTPLILCLAVDPSRPQTIYAGTAGSGVFVSDDGGATWTMLGTIPNAFVTSLAVDPRGGPRTVYAGTEGGGVFRTVRP